MATDAPQIPDSRPSWGRIALALVIALASDAFSFLFSATVVAEPVVIAVDLATALAIWAVLGRPTILLVALVAEAIPGVGVLPLWTAVVGLIAFTGKLPGRGGGARTPPTSPPSP